MYKNLFVLFVLSVFVLSCEKEEFISTGNLVVEFRDPPNVVSIYPLENQTRPLFEIYMEGEKSKTRKLNMGNYYCVVGDINANYAGVVFQIQSNKTTRIVYENNTPIVTYP
ncbi:hypothetical protein DMA11_13660 [Marinilabiliaceae bacterium JC017]|nr:hypothetical protein DMA11_13660 [Marinilabiliaceae bacterium JC017]